MPTLPLTLLLQLPPLTFGPVLPPPAFRPPLELVCEIRDLGRPRPITWPAAVSSGYASVDPHNLRPTRERHLVNPLVDGLLVLGALAATGGSWSEDTWSQRVWSRNGATPVLIPPLAPPSPISQR